MELLVIPLNGLILRALGVKPMRLSELRIHLGGPALTTLRGHLVTLTELGAVERGGGDLEFGPNENGLTELGRELLLVVFTLEAWLAGSPAGPIPLGGESAKGALRALAGGWESTMMRAFAGRPLSLTQLDRLIGPASYPSLERKLSAMRATGMVEAGDEDTDGTPYALTAWGSSGLGTIMAASRFEYRNLRTTTKRLAAIDIEATLMLGVPLAVFPVAIDGACSLVAKTGKSRRMAGVELTFDRGRVLSCVTQLEDAPRNWARGSSASWLDAIVIHDVAGLSFGGDRALVGRVVLALHKACRGDGGSG